MNRMNLTRMDVIVAVSKCFDLDKSKVEKELNKQYPKAFHFIITMKEYQEFVNKIKKEYK